MRIIISENQVSLLREAALDSFSLQELSNLRSFKERQQYCRQHLGLPIGNGSSRQVYQIDDEKVLKLAKNQKGLVQNEYEGQPDYYKDDMSIFSKVFQTADDYSWIVSEYVLPAKEQDFRHCLGMSFNEWKRVVLTMQNQHRHKTNTQLILSRKEFDKLCEKIPMIYELNDFIGSYSDFAVDDLYNIKNYGLTQRKGKPQLVILDSGLSYDIYNNYYKPFNVLKLKKVAIN